MNIFLRFLENVGIWISVRFPQTGFKMPPKYNYFKPEEVIGLDCELVAKLDWARGRAGVPFVITSGKRTVEENTKAGGVSESAHMKGLAVDLRCADSNARYCMVQALVLVGFKRIGLYTKHLHCDLDPTLPQEVIWMGESH